MRRAVSGPKPLGAYSAGIVADGPLVFVAGQGPMREGVYQPGTIAEETQLALENVGRILAAAGSGFERVVQARVFLADIDDFEAMNEVYARFFPEPRPARTTVQAGALPGGIKVEIDCVARLP